MVLRLGRAAHRGRHPRPARRRRAGPISTKLWIADLGHPEHRDAGHDHRPLPRGAGGVPGGAQHHAVAVLHPAGRASDHRLDPLDQFADLGASADRDHRPGRLCRHPRHRDPLHRVLRQAALRGDRGDRGNPGRGDHRHRRQPLAGHGLRDRAPDHAGLRGRRRLSLGHQHPQVDGARAGRRGRHRPAAFVLPERARLAAGLADPAGDPRSPSSSANGSRPRCGARSSDAGHDRRRLGLRRLRGRAPTPAARRILRRAAGGARPRGARRCVRCLPARQLRRVEYRRDGDPRRASSGCASSELAANG